MDQAAKLRDIVQKAQEQAVIEAEPAFTPVPTPELDFTPVHDFDPAFVPDSASKREWNKPKAKVITVTSGKGGVGKSNISVNLAIQFQKQGKKVIIFDADFGLANVEVIFGVLPKYNILDLISKDMSVFDVLTEGPMGIRFLSGGSGIGELLKLSDDQMDSLVRQLQLLDEDADIIIIDTGAGISEIVFAFAMVSNDILVITTPEPTAITDAYALIKSVYQNPQFPKMKPKIRLLVNKARTQKESEEVFQKLNKVAERFLNLTLVQQGYLPEDRSLVDAVIERKPFSLLYPKAAVSRAIEKVANQFLEEEKVMVPDEGKPVTKGLSHIFNKLFRRG